MNSEQAEAQLTSEGLRIAESWERGWFWIRKDENGERITWWVTDEQGDK